MLSSKFSAFLSHYAVIPKLYRYHDTVAARDGPDIRIRIRIRFGNHVSLVDVLKSVI